MNKKKRTVAVITATRAEYGLFFPVLKEIEFDPDLNLEILATGAHLVDRYGSTLNEITSSGFKVQLAKSFLDLADTALDITKNYSNSINIASKYLHKIKPDILLVLGDRYEMMAFAISALLLHIPIAHIAGGEITTGAMDDLIRHAITKLASIHFPATDLYAKRIIQMGESPSNVYVVGSTGVENATKIKLSDRKTWQEENNFKLSDKNLLATFHPVTNEIFSSQQQLKSLFSALDQNQDISVLFTAPNADESGKALLTDIKNYVEQSNGRAHLIESRGFSNYLSALQFFDGVIGNSSSGIIEAPSFQIGTINIGKRQNGRTKAGSVIDCKPDTNSICEAITHLYSLDFQQKLKKVKNPFYQKNTSQNIKNIIKEVDLQDLSSKEFHEVKL